MAKPLRIFSSFMTVGPGFLSTFHDGVSLEDLLLDPRVLTADGRQELQDQFGALRLSSTRLTAATSNKTMAHIYRIRPNRRPGPLRKFVLYHKCQKIIKWAIIIENKVKSQDKDRQVGDNKRK